MDFVRIASMTSPLLVILICGCGPRVAEVRGKVTFDGKSVTAGLVTFAPKGVEGKFEAGKPATAVVDQNGEFKLSTFQEGDGALVGVHNVSYQAPGPPRDDIPKMAEAYKQFGHLRLKSGFEFEVKPGVNNIKLELERAQ